MALTGGAPLLRTRLAATGGAAITLPAITRATQKETRSAPSRTTKALAERLCRVVNQHRSRLVEDRHGCAAVATSPQLD